ncbi:hypothetical protein RKD23_003162 [Streptomyces sp. SAI-170]|uniref:tetratricopeptide repeat protein n=1 Tax=Streptomyces sp. SAI-170 TaxID=3377729 RepID=UPI003C79ADD0
MTRSSRGEQREQPYGVDAPAAGPAAPLDVRVTAAGALVDEVRVTAASGEEIQRAVLKHLHTLARASGRPVLALVHDERIGYVVPLQVDPDGASRFTGEPVRVRAESRPESHRASQDAARQVPGATPEGEEPSRSGVPGGEVAGAGSASSVSPSASSVTPSLSPSPSSSPAPSASPSSSPAASVPSASPSSSPAASVPSTSSALSPAASASSSPSPAAPAPSPSPVSPSPAGGFGPPPVMGVPSREVESCGGGQAPVRSAGSPYVSAPQQAQQGESNPYLRPTEGPRSESGPSRPSPQPSPHPTPAPLPTSKDPMASMAPPAPPAPAPTAPAPPASAPTPPRTPLATTAPMAALASAAFVESSAAATSATPTPPRGFDAIAEAVLDDDQSVPGPLAEPMAGINEAVRSGQVERAAELAGRVLGEASRALGDEHPDVLRLRELAAYIAYLAGDGERALTLSLELARTHRRRRDAEAAYSNVQSAATAWRAVRDPRLGLHLGRELIGLWTELAAEGGPAGDDLEELESAHARMGRLTQRAERAARAE